ncbi:AAA family ATPase [Massilibacteroides vaginae]|uniref:AAA family ATPase n=1 Tax=Massilibacteroides vaginae TaxID=1673718 RepID=UPI000A1C9051|nr:AAA family ATPase [Massilibacteroides vaginae]
MYISSLKLWNFRKYGNSEEVTEETIPHLEVPLNKGLNVLIGENDSGKSAILDAIKLDGIPTEICSVHSVKGQTHCATMYVETFYKAYETKKLVVQSKPATKKRDAEFFNNPLLKQSHNFARPTHLLCFAVLKDNLSDEQLSYFKSSESGWLVIDLTEGCNSPE